MTARTLVLIRHAKAVQDAPTDVQRPLADRGHRDATAAGRLLSELSVVFDRVVVSPAVRTRETWEDISANSPARAIEFDDRIYENTVDDLLAVIAGTPDDVATLALVGHNPATHGLALSLSDGDGDPDGEIAIRRGYPTCGIAIFDITTAWTELGSGDATLRTFIASRG